jgi:hypothetical protein
MPNICRFAGILIAMPPKDHNPPHFHAYYGDCEACFTLAGDMIAGDLPSKQRKMVELWARQRQKELLENWELCYNGKRPKNIQPLAGGAQ